MRNIIDRICGRRAIVKFCRCFVVIAEFNPAFGSVQVKRMLE
jgi:hypothetical protein